MLQHEFIATLRLNNISVLLSFIQASTIKIFIRICLRCLSQSVNIRLFCRNQELNYIRIMKLIYLQFMINQVEQSSNQYGFYAVPKALQPKKKYRETLQQESKYSDEEVQDQNQYESLEREAENQKELERDFYVDEAPYPQFKPKEKGLDYGVQIQRHELFDFQLEVQPLIEILVGRSVVSAINELQEEKQQNQRESLLENFQKKRNAELMQTQRLQNKHNRKQDEAKRRVLQKQTFMKNKKIATEKLIGHRNAKRELLNLRSEILGQLEEEGFLRQSSYLVLRVQYQSWLYEQIKGIVNQRKKIEDAAQNLIAEKEKQIKKEHETNMQKENKKKKDILDERERVRKQNEQRKLKKKIRKQRLHLNSERSVKFSILCQLVQKYEPVEKILKSDSLSNGLTSKRNTPTTVNIAGGLINFVLALLNSSSANYSSQEIQNILEKLLNELSGKLEIQVSAAHFAIIQSLKKKIESQPIQFMTYKDNWIQDLITKISLELSVLQTTGINIKTELHSNFLSTLMSIYLNALPAPKMEGDQVVSAYEPTERDRKREELKNKIQFISVPSTSIEQIKKVENVVRIRFQRNHPAKEESSGNGQQQQKQVDLDEWIDIYDGQGWKLNGGQENQQISRQTQHAASFALNGFDQALVVDERNLYYLSIELEKLLGLQGGEELAKYRERLENIIMQSKETPIYDVQLKWQ